MEITLHDADAQPRWNGQPNADWCICDAAGPAEWIFRDDRDCTCGVEKHHYHCPHCGGLKQIG